MAYNSEGKQRNRVQQKGVRKGTATKKELAEYLDLVAQQYHHLGVTAEEALVQAFASVYRMRVAAAVALVINAITILALWSSVALTWWLIS